MEIGLLGFDGIQGSGNGFASVSVDSEASDQKWARRNEDFKQDGFGLCGDVCRTPKLAKTDHYFSLENSPAVSSDPDKLRFFCHSKPENSALPYFDHMAAAHTKNAGYYYSGGLSASSGMYLLSGVRGPFTPSQWLELEQQALIYKYMKENEPIPLPLLIPIVKAFESAGLFGFNGGNCRPTSWGMGPFHLGYSNSTDPEPGRCRRTDGKKWRCARDAVVNQKYCERHMNRGRHRSRKHVEGQGNGNGHSMSGLDKSSNTTNLMSSSVVASSSNNFDINQHHNYHAKTMQSLASSPNTNVFVDRMIIDSEKSDQGFHDASSVSNSKYQLHSGFESVSCQSLLDVVSQTKTNGCYPMSRADFMTSTSSSPIRLSQELEMCLGVGSYGESHKQVNWTPGSYGPLGEALKTSGSCQLSSSSPTRVLQKSGFASLSSKMI